MEALVVRMRGMPLGPAGLKKTNTLRSAMDIANLQELIGLVGAK